MLKKFSTELLGGLQGVVVGEMTLTFYFLPFVLFLLLVPFSPSPSPLLSLVSVSSSSFLQLECMT